MYLMARFLINLGFVIGIIYGVPHTWCLVCFHSIFSQSIVTSSSTLEVEEGQPLFQGQSIATSPSALEVEEGQPLFQWLRGR